jgi:hypothetical protein
VVIRRLSASGQPGQKVSKTPSINKAHIVIMPIIPSTQEAQVGGSGLRLAVQKHETLSKNN